MVDSPQPLESSGNLGGGTATGLNKEGDLMGGTCPPHVPLHFFNTSMRPGVPDRSPGIIRLMFFIKTNIMKIATPPPGAGRTE